MTLLVVAVFLIPLMGGQLANDSSTLEPTYGATVQATMTWLSKLFQALTLGRVQVLYLGSEVAIIQHTILALIVLACFAYLVIKRKIFQVPHPWVSAPMAAFLALLACSVFMSNYRWQSLSAFFEWATYGFAVLAVVSGIGRKNGPLAALTALSGGCGLAALLGIFEYGQTRATDPSWRIFSVWNNPNALAGMMVIGLILSLGILAHAFLSETKTTGNLRLGALAALSALLCGMAILLTGSKGGLLSLLVGCVCLLVLLSAWKKPAATLPVIGCLVLIAIFSLALQRGGGLRVANASATSEQSAGFRMELWKGAVALTKENPVGHGLATYPFFSAKPGLTTRTELAHSTWLQLAVEGGVFAPVALLVMLIGWLVLTFRSARSLPAGQNALRAAVVSAVVATAVHGLVESNLYFYGIGLAFFMLIGIGIQLSADAGAPEFVAPPVRIGAVAASVVCLILLGFAGYVSKTQANLRWLVANRPSDAPDAAAELRSIAPFDGETWYRSGWTASNSSEALTDYRRAADIAPSAKYLRRLAGYQLQAGQMDAASTSLHEALLLDPNNLFTLRQLMEVEDKLGQQSEAILTARKLVLIEQTPYFRIRSIPESVPTETYEARVYLVSKTDDKLSLLKDAVSGFLEFTRRTIPYARRNQGEGIGMTMNEALHKVQEGLDAASTLQALYQKAGDRAGMHWAADAIETFQAAIRDNATPSG